MHMALHHFSTNPNTAHLLTVVTLQYDNAKAPVVLWGPGYIVCTDLT
jgi:hypothetical protein